MLRKFLGNNNFEGDSPAPEDVIGAFNRDNYSSMAAEDKTRKQIFTNVTQGKMTDYESKVLDQITVYLEMRNWLNQETCIKLVDYLTDKNEVDGIEMLFFIASRSFIGLDNADLAFDREKETFLIQTENLDYQFPNINNVKLRKTPVGEELRKTITSDPNVEVYRAQIELSIEDELERMTTASQRREENPRMIPPEEIVVYAVGNTAEAVILERIYQGSQEISAQQEIVFREWVGAPEKEHRLGFDEAYTIADFQNDPLLDIKFFRRPEIGSTHPIDLDKVEKVARGLVDDSRDHEHAQALLESTLDLKAAGETEAEVEITGFTLFSVRGASKLSNREIDELFPYLIDQDGDEIIDDKINFSIYHPVLGAIDEVPAEALGLENVNSQITYIHKIKRNV
jgi:hypothetical protein